MGCHRTVRSDSPSIAALRRVHEARETMPWARVYKVPDFVVFSHVRHVNARVQCADCHGPVEERDVLAKEVSTGMISCMNCHAKRAASNACNVCHDLGQ